MPLHLAKFSCFLPQVTKDATNTNGIAKQLIFVLPQGDTTGRPK